MPQTFLAVRCCSCSAFQGIQRTQQSKYACKLCNTKQSITRVFASGTGKEVRLAVQTLNRARLEAAAVAQEEANAEYDAHYEQEHPDEYAEADGEYAEEAARCSAIVGRAAVVVRPKPRAAATRENIVSCQIILVGKE